MTNFRRPLLALSVLVLAGAGTVPQGAGDPLTVTRKETKLRSQKRVFAPPVADLHEGDKLVCESRDGAWLQAKFGAVEGFVHESDVTANKEVRLSGEGVRENYSASEAAAARKGFNPQVEREYRNSNPNLNAAFALVDKISALRVGEAEMKAFLQDGGLWHEESR
jgi:hypothetical protein